MAEFAAVSITCTELKQVIYQLTVHVRYSIYLNKNIAKLNEKVVRLITQCRELEASVQRMERSCGEQVTSEVQRWLETAATIVQNGNDLQTEVDHNKRYLMGFFSNWCWRHSLSTEAKRQLDIVVEHLSNGNFERVTMPRPPPTVEVFLDIPKVEVLASAKSSMEKIMDALLDEKIRMIGVHGMAGVGKTTIVKNVNNQLVGNPPLFNMVIMVTVSKDVDLRSLQSKIANRLDFNLEDESEISRARKLRQRLMQEKKFLIILDDLWDKIDLNDVGIPYGDDCRGCKVLFTSRQESVCRKLVPTREMLASDLIKVDFLSEQESWELFKVTAGDVVEDSALQAISMEIAKECAGLPLAIVTLGTDLRNVDNPKVWECTLMELKMSAPPTFIRTMEQEVHQSLRKSYDPLPEDVKMCFLFCCLFPDACDIEKDYLIKYWMVEGFLKNVRTWKEALLKGHTIFEILKDSCFLLDGEKFGCRMHDIVRDVAINIASNDRHKFLVKAGFGLNDWKRVDRKNEKKLSLIKNLFKELAGRVVRPQLLTLMMQENLNLCVIQDEVFRGMTSLRVLDLSNTYIQWLPPTISKLVNLKKLSLRECWQLATNSLSILGELEKLEFLDLSRTNIEKLPSEFESLTKLRCLDLSLTQRLKSVPSKVVSKLTSLEELKMFGSSYKWEIEGGVDGSNATLMDVASLNQLTCLFLCMESIYQFLPDVVFESWARLDRFCFFWNYRLGDSIDIKKLEEMSAYCRTISISDSNTIPEWIKKLFSKTTYLRLERSNGVRSIMDLAVDTSCAFQCLEHLEIKDCHDMEYLVARNSIGMELALHGSLGRLKSLKIIGCQNLTSIVSSLVLAEGWLPNLNNLDVRDCNQIKEIISEESVVDTTGILFKLRTVSFVNLPKLECFFGGRDTLNLHSLREIHVCCCPSMKKLPLEAHNAPSLKLIDGSQSWWDKLQWQEGVKPHFESKFSARSASRVETS